MSTEPSAAPPVCVGIGEVLWDLLPGGKALGGAPVNVAAHAAQLGLRAVAVSAVGADVLGEEILESVATMGVHAGHVRIREDLPTSVVDVRLDAAGVPTFDIRLPSAWDALIMDSTLAELAVAADAAVFGTLAQRDPRSRECIRAFLRSTRPECLRFLDINLRQPFYSAEVVLDSLALANVLKLNDGELGRACSSVSSTRDARRWCSTRPPSTRRAAASRGTWAPSKSSAPEARAERARPRRRWRWSRSSKAPRPCSTCWRDRCLRAGPATPSECAVGSTAPDAGTTASSITGSTCSRGPSWISSAPGP